VCWPRAAGHGAIVLEKDRGMPERAEESHSKRTNSTFILQMDRGVCRSCWIEAESTVFFCLRRPDRLEVRYVFARSPSAAYGAPEDKAVYTTVQMLEDGSDPPLSATFRHSLRWPAAVRVVPHVELEEEDRDSPQGFPARWLHRGGDASNRHI
jgi:hypothetical protein